MKKMKRPMLLVAATVFLLATALAGCGGSKSESSDPAPSTSSNNENKSSDNGEKKEASGEKWELGAKPLEFSLYSHYDNIDFPVWDSTPAGKWLKENKQVDIKMISAGGNKAQKMSAMIASDELPDVIWGDRNDPDTERLREAGKLVAFDDYLDKYPNLKTWMGDLNMLRADDGKLYQFPNWYTGRPAGNAGYAINKKIYEELGSPKLETTDDLYDYLKKVKEKYGSGIIPFEPHMAKDAQGLGVLYTAFGEGAIYTSLNNGLLAVPKGDKLTSLFTDPVFREANKYIAKLYREKLISQDAFNQTEDQVKEKVMSGRVAVFAGASPTTFAMEADAALTKKDPNAGYFMIWPIHKPGLDKNKIYPGTYTSLGWNVSVITTAAKDPEAIFAFLDWYTGPEGQNLLFFGPEGGNWKGFDSEGKPNFTDNYNAEAVAKIQAENDKVMINGNTSYIDPAKMKYEMSLPVEKQNWSARYQSTITWPTQYNVTEFINLNPAPDSELGITKQAVTDLFLEVYASMIIKSQSDADVDKILDKAEADAQKLGYDKLLEFRTEKWQANKAKLAGK
ncbi:extracellular solute-binding protein [Paenibacillus donghaensis]|uniref:extracellular solute-binding protein n=1 Tax=Paenibacillus donghaensis TaxID=414771 RepID=UPI0018837D0B|nr:extracellular solute-binding protein [Paenibacillus donghaensis]MBE9914528.1 extracellular solute-binding protein [Paenibacillus donghaensis]